MENLFSEAVLIFGGAIVTTLTAVLAKLFQYLSGKVKSGKVSDIIMRVDDLAIKVVSDVHQTYVKEIIKAKSDGVLTKDEQGTAKKKAIEALRLYLGPKGLNELKWLITGDSGLDNFLGSVIENVVFHNQKELKKK